MTRRARLQKGRLRGSERRASKGGGMTRRARLKKRPARTAAAIDWTVNEV